MTESRLLIATRSSDKLREIRQILAPVLPPARIVSLADIGFRPEPAEESIEAFDTFQENALAKARFFFDRTGLLTLADDSGLCVDALGGAPGVRSKRFSGRKDLAGVALDEANTDLLIQRLNGAPLHERTAQYVCAVAVALSAEAEALFRGECPGHILETRSGSGGFGYDPVFRPAGYSATFGDLPPEVKNRLSHRASAVRAAAATLRSALDPPQKPE